MPQLTLPEARYELDLNNDRVPEKLLGAFDLVINAGTTEHLANQENAFRVIHDLTRRGGLMYHEVPGGSCTDHGFVAYQPKFFHRLMQQNDYQRSCSRSWHRRQCRAGLYPRIHRPYGDTMPKSVIEIALRIGFANKAISHFLARLMPDLPGFIGPNVVNEKLGMAPVIGVSEPCRCHLDNQPSRSSVGFVF